MYDETHKLLSVHDVLLASQNASITKLKLLQKRITNIEMLQVESKISRKYAIEMMYFYRKLDKNTHDMINV